MNSNEDMQFRLPEEEYVSIYAPTSEDRAQLLEQLQAYAIREFGQKCHITIIPTLPKLVSSLENGNCTAAIVPRLESLESFTTIRRVWAAIQKRQGRLILLCDGVDTFHGAGPAFDAVIRFFAKKYSARAFAGVAAAAARGTPVGRPPMPEKKVERLKALVAVFGPRPRAIAAELGVSHATVITYLKKLGLEDAPMPRE